MKLMWTGSDVLFATQIKRRIKMPYKKWHYMIGLYLFAKIADWFVQEHYVVSYHLIKELALLNLKKDIKVVPDVHRVFGGLEKKEHKGFTVLCYVPEKKNQKFTDWLYGWDIIEDVIDYLSKRYVVELSQDGAMGAWLSDNLSPNNVQKINFILVDGNSDIEEVYPMIDIYVRPNRHDGNPRMILECEDLGIPYYWSKSQPSFRNIVEAILSAKYNKETGHKSNNVIDA